MFGTGNVIYAQAGYLLKKDLLGEGNGTLMPYVTLQSAKYDRLDKPNECVGFRDELVYQRAYVKNNLGLSAPSYVHS